MAKSKLSLYLNAVGLVPRNGIWLEYSDFLKERLFGLSNPQGNHGESVKEAHFHVDNTPTVNSFINPVQFISNHADLGV